MQSSDLWLGRFGGEEFAAVLSDTDLNGACDLAEQLRRQVPADGRPWADALLLEILLAQGTRIRLCKSCTDARGITALPLIEGIEVGTLPLLAQWTLAADKVLTF